MARTYRFLSDPSHGWLRVNVTELHKFELIDKISPYSYIRDTNVYLEEDCDAGLFVQALEASGVTPKIEANRQANQPSRIRSYPSYTPDRAMQVIKEKYNFVGSSM